MLKMRNVCLAVAVASVLAAPMAQAAKGEFTFGLNGGMSIPSGDFGDVAKSGFTGGVFGDYWVSEPFALGVNLGYTRNNGKDLDPGEEAKRTTIEVEGHGKWMPPMTDSQFAPYIEGGAGLYRMKDEFTFGGTSSDTTFSKFGFHFGAGVGYKATPQVTVGVGGSFHIVPKGLELVDITTLAVEEKSAQYIKVGVNVTFATTGAGQ